MSAPIPSSSRNIRALVAADLERVIAIDRIHFGRSRRHFFEKRFANATSRPDDFVQIGAANAEGLQGFAVARIMRGEFGQKDIVAVLDAVGVDPQSREHGIGQSLMDGLIELSGLRGARGAVAGELDQSRAAAIFQRRTLQTRPAARFGAPGCRLAPRCGRGTMTVNIPSKAHHTHMIIPERVGDAVEINYSQPPEPDFGPLARDRIPVRAMKEVDLRALVDIDKAIIGYNRAAYFERKLEEALYESDVRVSLVAELDGNPVGFIMARVDFGEFGHVEPTAVLDTIGVSLEYRNRGVGRALLSQLLTNLMTLRVESIRTELEWHEHELLAFLDHCGFQTSQRLCLEHAIR